jgi:hypothetical protein
VVAERDEEHVLFHCRPGDEQRLLVTGHPVSHETALPDRFAP